MTDARTDEQHEREAFEQFISKSSEHRFGLDWSFRGGWTANNHWAYNDYATQSHWLCWRAATRRFA
jgi:hypothetical protein